MTHAEPLFEALHISKAYPGVQALNDVSFELRAGEIHALVGVNGAGKSTLVKIMVGAERPDSGTMRLRGREMRPRSVQEAHQRRHCRRTPGTDAGAAPHGPREYLSRG